MTAVPGDPATGREDARRIRWPRRCGSSTSPNERGLLVRLMGGMAIRAHAPDWPARTRRVEVDLDFATRCKDRGAFYELLARRGLHAGQAPQRAVRRQAGLLRRRPAQPPGRRARGQPRDVPSLRVRRPARRRRARPCRSPSCCCRSSRSSRSTARTSSTRSSCSPSIRSASDDGAPDARHGLGAINVPRILSFTSNDWGWWRTVTGNLDTLDQYLAVELDARGPRPQQRPGRPVRPGDPDRQPADGHRRRAEVDALEAARAGRRAARPGTRSPRRWGTAADAGLLRDRHPRLRGVLAQVPQRRQVPQGRRPDHGRRHDRQGDGPDRRQRLELGAGAPGPAATS